MEDPIRRVQRLGASQAARQDQNSAAGEEWAKMVPSFLEYAQKVAAPLKADHDVLIAKAPEGFIIQFGQRIAGQNAGGGWVLEKGPQAHIVFSRVDGKVHAYRRPAHLPPSIAEFHEFTCLGEPANVTQEAIGQAVADFLEWGAAGEGRSRFSTPLQ